MSKYNSIVAFLLLLFSIVSVSGCSKSSGGMPPAAVEFGPVKAQSWQASIIAIGTLSANQGVVITPEVDGRVTSVFFHSGDDIVAGAPLVQLNPTVLQAQLEAAQAKEILSKANYTRALELFKKKVFAQQDLDTALSSYRSDDANVASIQAQLNQTLIRAPFSGRLGLRMVDIGDYLHAGGTVANLNSIDTLRIDFRVPQVYLSRIKPGQTVLIKSSAYPNKAFKGQIYATDSEIDANTRSLGIRAILPNKDHKLLPGTFVDVTIETGTPQYWPAAPETAISFDANGQYVYRVINNKAVKTPIVLGPRRDGNVAITNGLKPGDVIITAGGFKVNDGDPVMPGK